MKRGIPIVHQRNTLTKDFLYIFSLLWVLLLHSQVQAQSVTLTQILEKGIENYPFLKAKKAEVNSTQSKLASSKLDYLPSFVIGDQYTFGSGNNVNGAFFPNEGTVFSPSGGIRPENVYQGVFGSIATAMVDWRFFNFGKVKANIKSVQADVNRSQADYANELFQHQVKIADAYLVLLINQKLVQAQEHNLERAKVFKRVTDAGVSSGLRPGIDSSLASAEFAKAQLLLLESKRAERTQQLRLSELSGVIDEQLTIDPLSFYSRLPQGNNADITFLKNPALLLSQAQIDMSMARSQAIRKSFLPSISFTAAGWGRGSGVSNQDNSMSSKFSDGTHFQVYNYLFGLSSRWNISQIFKVRKEFQAEQFQIERFKEVFNTQKLQLDRQSKEATIQLNFSLDQAALTPIQLKAAQTAFNQAEARYQSGLTDLFTLAQSVHALNRAEIDRFIAFGSAWRALLQSAAASGDLSLFLSQIN